MVKTISYNFTVNKSHRLVDSEVSYIIIYWHTSHLSLTMQPYIQWGISRSCAQVSIIWYMWCFHEKKYIAVSKDPRVK